MLAQDIIIRPVITEQSMTQAQDKKYTFIVAKNSNKTEIKKAVQEIFKVNVEKVNTMNYAGKTKRSSCNLDSSKQRNRVLWCIKGGELNGYKEV